MRIIVDRTKLKNGQGRKINLLKIHGGRALHTDKLDN